MAYRFGRNRPSMDHPRMQLGLGEFLAERLPEPPEVCHYGGKAWVSLRQVYENDRLGCCVISGMAHGVGVLTGNSGVGPVIFSDRNIVEVYGEVGGYVEGHPETDLGCDIPVALDYWQKTGFKGHRIEGSISVAPEHAKLALWLFELLVFGVELPDAWVNPFPQKDGFMWGEAGEPNPEQGHCFVGHGYNLNGVTIDEWGMVGNLAWDALHYATTEKNGELHAVVSKEALNRATQRAPNGLDWEGLRRAFRSLGGQGS